MGLWDLLSKLVRIWFLVNRMVLAQIANTQLCHAVNCDTSEARMHCHGDSNAST